MGFDRALVPVGPANAAAAGPLLPVLLPATSGQGLQISRQLTRGEGKVFYNLKFKNHTQIPLYKFMIQFNKNTFGLAVGGPLKVLEALDDSESTIRELAASTMFEMLKNQKDRLDKDTEVLLEKLLQLAKDPDLKS